MRENRTYGSEGGEARSLPYPYHLLMRERSRHARKTPYSPRRERARALEGRPRRAAIDVAVE